MRAFTEHPSLPLVSPREITKREPPWYSLKCVTDISHRALGRWDAALKYSFGTREVQARSWEDTPATATPTAYTRRLLDYSLGGLIQRIRNIIPGYSPTPQRWLPLLFKSGMLLLRDSALAAFKVSAQPTLPVMLPTCLSSG